MSPLADPRPRSTRWQLAAAHGHYVDEARDPNRLIGSWLIHREELIATGSDYIALGHWNQATPVGNGEIAAYYSGSPEYAGTVNVVRLRVQRQGRSIADSAKRFGKVDSQSTPSTTGFFGFLPSSTRITSSAAPHSPRFDASNVTAPRWGVRITLSS